MFILNLDEQILKQINKTLELVNKITNKTTIVYLNGLFSLKCDYESIGDYTNACEYCDTIIDLLTHNKIIHTDEDKQHVSDVLVSCYDTKARQGNFEAFCIAMEWNRPINKQFYIPRARLLKKHGVIQGVQDLIDDKLDLLVLNLPPL